MNYAKIRNYDIANGEGVRTSLFVSGCTNHCPGCFNSEEQDFNCGRPFTKETIAEIHKMLANPVISGLSLLGGDPLCQDYGGIYDLIDLCFYTHSIGTHWREEYQVWLLSKEDFDNICAIDNDDWKDDWGWWRHAYGSNLGAVDCAYVINGEKLMAWDGLQRKEWCRDCSDCAGTEKDKDECFHDHQYPDILIYLCDEIGASTERNVCACTIDLARQNNLTLAELFKKYLG